MPRVSETVVRSFAPAPAKGGGQAPPPRATRTARSVEETLLERAPLLLGDTGRAAAAAGARRDRPGLRDGAADRLAAARVRIARGDGGGAAAGGVLKRLEFEGAVFTESVPAAFVDEFDFGACDARAIAGDDDDVADDAAEDAADGGGAYSGALGGGVGPCVLLTPGATLRDVGAALAPALLARPSGERGPPESQLVVRVTVRIV